MTPFAASTCRPTTYSAVFPLDPAPEIATRVAAHIESPCNGSVVLDGVTAMAVDVVGAHALLPVAQDAAVAEARSRGLRPCGWVWEQYLEIGPAAAHAATRARRRRALNASSREPASRGRVEGGRVRLHLPAQCPHRPVARPTALRSTARSTTYSLAP